MAYPLDRPLIDDLVQALRKQHPHRTFIKPLKHALTCLCITPVPWEWRGMVLHIRSRKGSMVYHCTGDTCTCKARVTDKTPLGWCWHKVAWHLLIAERAITDPFGLIRR